MLIDALIPARKGSKRLPGKHLRSLGGRPLIEWTFADAVAAGLSGRVCLSTDDDALVALAARWSGIDVLQRPPALATDSCGSAEVALHYLESPLCANRRPDWLLLLQPTSPFRGVDSIRRAVGQKRELVSVGPLKAAGSWLRALDADGACRELQDAREACQLNGALYLISVERFLADPVILSSGVQALQMTATQSVDVDTEQDLLLAESLLAASAVEGCL